MPQQIDKDTVAAFLLLLRRADDSETFCYIARAAPINVLKSICNSLYNLRTKIASLPEFDGETIKAKNSCMVIFSKKRPSLARKVELLRDSPTFAKDLIILLNLAYIHFGNDFDVYDD